MLGGQHFRWGEHSALPTGINCLQHRDQRHDGLTRTNLTLKQTRHGHALFNVRADFTDYLLLPRCQLEIEGINEHVLMAFERARLYLLIEMPLSNFALPLQQRPSSGRGYLVAQGMTIEGRGQGLLQLVWAGRKAKWARGMHENVPVWAEGDGCAACTVLTLLVWHT